MSLHIGLWSDQNSERNLKGRSAQWRWSLNVEKVQGKNPQKKALLI